MAFERLDARRVLSISGNVLTDNIFPVGDTDDQFFTITAEEMAAAGGQQVVTLSLSGAVGDFLPRARLFGPSGDQLDRDLLSGNKLKATLTQAGQYRIWVQDSDNNATGIYALSLEGLQPPSQDAQTIQRGDVKNGTIDRMGDVDAYTFTAAVGDVLTLSLAGTDITSYEPRAELYSPSGKAVKLYSATTGNRVSQVSAGNKVISETLSEAGTYVLQVFDDDYMHTGTYAAALEGLTPPSADAVAIALGEVKSGAIALGEVDAYKFTGEAGAIVTVSLSDFQPGTDTELWSELYSPSGQKVEKLAGTNGPDEVENGHKVTYALPATGTYVIQVFDGDYTDTENYAVALEGLNPPSLDATSITFGQPRNDEIEVMGEVDAYRFTITASELAAAGGQYGVRLSLDSEDTVDYRPRAMLYAPSGLKVGQEINAGQTSALTLLSAGTYVIQVYDNDYTDAQDGLIYTLTLQDAEPPAVLSVTASPTLLSDADVGAAAFSVAVLFGETMDTSTPPALVFGDGSVAGGFTPTLSNPMGAWSSTTVTNDTWTVTYDVADQNVAVDDVTIDVLQAQDVAGNVLQNYFPEPEFDVDTQNPAVSVLTPRDDAGGVGLETSLRITFFENIQRNVGSITIKKSSDDSVVESIPATSGQVTVSGVTATINPSVTLEESTGYYVEVAAGAFEDLAGNDFAGISGPTTWNFTTADLSGPAVSSLSPPDGATGVAADTNLTITFNEDVQSGTGSLAIKRSSDGSTVETISVPGGPVTVAGATATIDPSVTLAEGTEYYVEVAPGTFEDLVGNDFAGLQGATAWNFTTADLPPAVVSLSPADDAEGVRSDTDLVIAFDQEIQPGTGEIAIKRSSDGSTVETIPVSGGQVTVTGTTATIDPNVTFLRRTGYYVEVAAGALEDLSGNDFAGVSGASAWNFTTAGPITVDDTATTGEDAPLGIPVLNNDLGAGQTLDPDTVALVAGSGPTHGTATIGGGLVTYTPAANFSGTDSFRYTVRDVAGFVSNEALVTITVVAVPDYQNPLFREDVNHSGDVSPIDVLILINYINNVGNALPPDPTPPATPEFYYDVDGNGIVAPRDVLMVINYINRILPGGEGEAPTVWNSAVDASGQDVAARPRALRIGPTDDATPRVAEERPGPSGLDVALRDLTEDPSELLGWTPEDLLSVLARDVAA